MVNVVSITGTGEGTINGRRVNPITEIGEIYIEVSGSQRLNFVTTAGDFNLVADVFNTTDGILTDFPAAQRWVPVLGTNQAYLSGFSANGFVNGIRLSSSPRSATSEAGGTGITGSWGAMRPAIGSLLISSGITLQVTAFENDANTISFVEANGTDPEIQAAFEYPMCLILTLLIVRQRLITEIEMT